MTAIALELRPIVDLSDEQFYQLCQANPNVKLERNKDGELLIMKEYLDSGLRLGFLIDPQNQRVEIYRQGQVEVLQSPKTLSGEDVLPGFVLDLKGIL